VAMPPTRRYRHLHPHILIEPVKYTHQPVDGEAVEPRLADAREVCRRDAGAGLGIAHRQPFGVERLDDFGGENGAELAQAGVGRAEVGKDIAGTSSRSSLSSAIKHFLQPFNPFAHEVNFALRR
jgi:hypothetical protein